MPVKNLQICGTSGTGKTTIVRHLMQRSDYREQHHAPSGKVLAYRGLYRGSMPIWFLGSYRTDCGGCDTIPKVKIVAELITEIAKDNDDGVIVCEGLMISHMLGTVGNAQIAIGLENCLRAYIDTPLEKCLERVQKRRWARGDNRDFNPDNTTIDWDRVWKSKARADRLGYPTAVIDHTTPFTSTEELLEELYGKPIS